MKYASALTTIVRSRRSRSTRRRWAAL